MYQMNIGKIYYTYVRGSWLELWSYLREIILCFGENDFWFWIRIYTVVFWRLDFILLYLFWRAINSRYVFLGWFLFLRNYFLGLELAIESCWILFQRQLFIGFRHSFIFIGFRDWFFWFRYWYILFLRLIISRLFVVKNSDRDLFIGKDSVCTRVDVAVKLRFEFEV